MKKIHFNHLRFKNWSTLIIALAFICVIAGFFELFPFHNEKNHSKVSALGYLLTAIYYSKMFWYRNYVEWNKLGMNIKLNKWLCLRSNSVYCVFKAKKAFSLCQLLCRNFCSLKRVQIYLVKNPT
jgi:hypothetical protein